MGSSGFCDFDQMSGGLWPGELTVIGGSPDMGKTALALNIAEHLAFKESKTAIYFSSDLSVDQLALRTLCSEGRISLENICLGKLTNHERERFASAICNLASGRLHFAWREGLSINQVLDGAAKYSKKCGNLGLVVVDYLQQLCTADNRPITNVEIAESLRQLKSLAKEFHCPVIAISQLPLNVEMRRNKRPVLGDMGIVDVIQKYADTVVLLYRDEVYTKNDCPEPGLVNLIFPIRRDGSSGQTKLVFLNQIAKFETLAC
jgi:replicative DNA helicase